MDIVLGAMRTEIAPIRLVVMVSVQESAFGGIQMAFVNMRHVVQMDMTPFVL